MIFCFPAVQVYIGLFLYSVCSCLEWGLLAFSLKSVGLKKTDFTKLFRFILWMNIIYKCLNKLMKFFHNEHNSEMGTRNNYNSAQNVEEEEKQWLSVA